MNLKPASLIYCQSLLLSLDMEQPSIIQNHFTSCSKYNFADKGQDSVLLESKANINHAL